MRYQLPSVVSNRSATVKRLAEKLKTVVLVYKNRKYGHSNLDFKRSAIHARVAEQRWSSLTASVSDAKNLVNMSGSSDLDDQ
jgi:hypothetical protein